MNPREVESYMRENGFSFLRPAKHGDLWTDGTSMVLASNRIAHSDSRAEHNFRAEVKRALRRRPTNPLECNSSEPSRIAIINPVVKAPEFLFQNPQVSDQIGEHVKNRISETSNNDIGQSCLQNALKDSLEQSQQKETGTMVKKNKYHATIKRVPKKERIKLGSELWQRMQYCASAYAIAPAERQCDLSKEDMINLLFYAGHKHPHFKVLEIFRQLVKNGPVLVTTGKETRLETYSVFKYMREKILSNQPKKLAETKKITSEEARTFSVKLPEWATAIYHNVAKKRGVPIQQLITSLLIKKAQEIKEEVGKAAQLKMAQFLERAMEEIDL